MAIDLTERAAREVKTIIEQQKLNAGKTCLRLGVKGGGCSGFSYTLDLTEDKGENDEEWTLHDVKIICDPKSFIYLEGTTVDFKDEIMGRGFIFSNPNATHTCGCGSSFSA
jgi:iron-sulfur cluster assembly protein